MACVDLAPNGSRQAPTRADVLNVRGFSDEVFTLRAESRKGSTTQHWVEKIESIALASAKPAFADMTPGP